MAILFADDFNGYGTNAAFLLNGLWGTNQCTIQADPDPTATGEAVRFAGAYNGARRPFQKGALGVAGVAYRLWLETLPVFTTFNMRMLDGSNANQCCFAVTPTGVVQIWAANGGSIGHGSATMMGQTSAPVLTATAWHHIEFKVDTVGNTAEVRIDGVSKLTCSGSVGSAYQIGLGTTDDYSGTAGVGCFYKDLVMWDGTGSYNTNFLGTVSVLGLPTSSDVTLGGWTPSSGSTGFNILANSPPVDSSYISAPVSSTASQFNLADVPNTVTTVKALITQVRAAKSDGGTANIQAALISSGTEGDGASRPITTAFTYYEDVFETDPHTGTAWTPISADAAILKVNRTA